MDLGLKGKVALLAAASKGLGFGTARALAREGAKASICSRALDTGQISTNTILNYGAACIDYALLLSATWPLTIGPCEQRGREAGLKV